MNFRLDFTFPDMVDSLHQGHCTRPQVVLAPGWSPISRALKTVAETLGGAWNRGWNFSFPTFLSIGSRSAQSETEPDKRRTLEAPIIWN